jgi:hypothetical protein
VRARNAQVWVSPAYSETPSFHLPGKRKKGVRQRPERGCCAVWRRSNAHSIPLVAVVYHENGGVRLPKGLSSFVISPSPQQGRFEGPIFAGRDGQHVYIYYPPDGSPPKYVTFLKDSRSFFSDGYGRPISQGVSTPSVAIVGGLIGAAFGGGPGAILGMALGVLAAQVLSPQQQ